MAGPRPFTEWRMFKIAELVKIVIPGYDNSAVWRVIEINKISNSSEDAAEYLLKSLDGVKVLGFFSSKELERVPTLVEHTTVEVSSVEITKYVHEWLSSAPSLSKRSIMILKGTAPGTFLVKAVTEIRFSWYDGPIYKETSAENEDLATAIQAVIADPSSKGI